MLAVEELVDANVHEHPGVAVELGSAEGHGQLPVDVAAAYALLPEQHLAEPVPVVHHLQIVDELMRSSTRMYAHPKALDDAGRRDRIEHLAMLIRSVLEARRRVMLEVNVPADQLNALIAVLPCMREPTVAKLAGDAGFAVKSAVPRKALPTLIPEIKACGGMDLVVSELAQIVP